jgi:hypothetical protein
MVLMSKPLRGITIAAAVMLAAGLLLAGMGYMAGGSFRPVYFDETGLHIAGFGKKSESAQSEKMDRFSENLNSFDSIEADLDRYEVDLIPSDKFAIEAEYNKDIGKPEVKVENNTLTIKSRKNKFLNVDIDLFGLTFNRDYQSIKIYYPKDTKWKNLALQVGVSDLDFDGLNAEKLDLNIDYGKLNLSNVNAGAVKVELDSGDCTLKNIQADDLNVNNDLGKTVIEGAKLKTFEMEADSGDVTITDITSDSSKLNLDLGKLTAKGLFSKGLKVTNDSGDINLQGTLLGTTDVTCDMGKVTISPGGSKDQFNYELNTDMGSATIGGDKVSGSIKSANSAPNTLKVKNSMGDINIVFN